MARKIAAAILRDEGEGEAVGGGEGEAVGGGEGEAVGGGEGEASAQPRLRKRRRLSKRKRANLAKQAEVVAELAEPEEPHQLETEVAAALADPVGPLDTHNLYIGTTAGGRSKRLPKKQRDRLRKVLHEQQEKETREWHNEVEAENAAMDREDSDIRSETAPSSNKLRRMQTTRSFEEGAEPPKKRRKSKKQATDRMSDDATIDEGTIPGTIPISEYGDGVPFGRKSAKADEPSAPSAPETQVVEPKPKSMGRGKGKGGKGGNGNGGKGGNGNDGKGKAEVAPEPTATGAESSVADGKVDGANADGVVVLKPKPNSNTKKKMTEAMHAGGRWFELRTTLCIAMANLEHSTNYMILCVFSGASGRSMIIYITSEAEKQERVDALLTFVDLTKDETEAAHLRI